MDGALNTWLRRGGTGGRDTLLNTRYLSHFALNEEGGGGRLWP